MMLVYWGSQYISSGFISVIFGLNPVITGIMAALWLNERGLNAARITGVLCGIAGLIVIFGQSMQMGEQAAMGVASVFIAVILHSWSSVWFKKLDPEMSALEITHGSLLISVPLYLLTWFVFQDTWPENITLRTLAAILYLGIFGSVIGFMLFFYILKHIEASRVALITLLTPVVALYLGYALNSEVLNINILLGSGLILLGMSFYHWGEMLFKVISLAR